MPNYRLLLPRVIVSAALVALLGVAAWRYNQTRAIPFDRAISPAYWIAHWRGEDRYNAQTGLLEHGNPKYREVALTIDDGPDPRYGPQIAALLHRRHIAATFFLVGIRVKQYPDVARLLAHDGFEIGNHTYDHQRLPALKPHEIANELRLCDARVFAVTREHTTLMRPPGVQYDDKVLHVAKALGYVTVSWTCGAPDYNSSYSADWISHRVLQRTEPGSIILLHQDNPSTVAALPLILDRLQSQGYRFVTISEMLAHLGVQRPASPAAAAR